MRSAVIEHALYTAAQLRAIDRYAIDSLGIAELTLMSRAAAAALRTLRAHWPRAWRITLLCGAGNNAGDAYLLASQALAAGLDPQVLYLFPPVQLRGAAAAAYAEAKNAGVSIRVFEPAALHGTELIVDGLLGTGLTRPLAPAWQAAVEAVNASGCPVLALDIPSGLSADSGAVFGAAIRADVTLTFIAPKVGLYTGMGPAYVGQVEIADLELVPESAPDSTPVAWRVDCASLVDALPGPRSRVAHKGHYGQVLVIGGQPGMSGAVRLAAEAAARVGAGRVTVATHPEHAAVINSGRPELMSVALHSADDLAAYLEQASVIALGPGLGQSNWAAGLLEAVWDSKRPLIVDADALNSLAAAPQQRSNWILTPHPGEAARMLGIETAAVQADRLAASRALQANYGGVVVLKGAGTLIADGSQLWLCSAGNPGMASAGMGDVLCGVIAGLLAQGLTLSTAALCGVLLHSCAADSAAVGGERGLLASDLFVELRRWLNLPA